MTRARSFRVAPCCFEFIPQFPIKLIYQLSLLNNVIPPCRAQTIGCPQKRIEPKSYSADFRSDLCAGAPTPNSRTAAQSQERNVGEFPNEQILPSVCWINNRHPKPHSRQGSRGG